MTEFHSYDSIEEMFAALGEAEDRANENVTEAQKSIGYGDYWVKTAHVGGGEYLTIYGYNWTRDEIVQGEIGAGSDVEAGELDYTMKVLDDSHSRGYRFGTAFSHWEPDGEVGDTHISTMTKITKEQFELARDLKWPSIQGE